MFCVTLKKDHGAQKDSPGFIDAQKGSSGDLLGSIKLIKAQWGSIFEFKIEAHEILGAQEMFTGTQKNSSVLNMAQTFLRANFWGFKGLIPLKRAQKFSLNKKRIP